MKNVLEAEKTFISKPMFAASAERILILNEIKSEHKDLPQPLRFAEILSALLERVSVPLEDYDLIAGRCVDRVLTEEEEAIFQSFIRHPDYPAHESLLSSGHCTYSWEMVVQEGLSGLSMRVKEKMNSGITDGQRIFLTGILRIYDAIRRYMLRYAEAARAKGMHDLSETLVKAATGKPDDFRTALQLLWIITLIDCAYITENPTLTVGRMDQFLYPLYCKDLNSGRLTREEAKALITDYYCKHNLIMGRGEHQVGDNTNSTTFQRICNFDAPQYLLLAGTDASGKPAVNELTQLFAECIRPSFKNPVVVVRYFKGMDSACPTLWQTLTEKALESASIMFYNDDNILRTYARMGIPEEDARNYAHFGCNWPSLGDRCAWMLGGPSSAKYGAYESEDERKNLDRPYMRTNAEHGWPEDFMIVFHELADCEDADENVSIEDFYHGFLARMENFIDRKLEFLTRELSVRQRKPSAVLTFGDCFFVDSIRNGECFSATAKYHFEMQSFYMFGTVADCFTVVDQLVFREKRLTLRRLLNAVENDFEGFPDVLALCRNIQKYGSDSALSNAHVKRLSRAAASMVIEKSRSSLRQHGLYLAPCFQSDTWHLKLGIEFGATPDGRRAHTPFSQNIRPANGSSINGLTAMLNAVRCIPDDGALSGALNLDISPRDFQGTDGHKRFSALLGVYLNGGGLHAQVSSADIEELKDAQIHPEQHRDLRVRVTGYSGIFVDISKKLQDDIIERMR